MNEKKTKGLRKVLLMSVACALVGAISVGVTLAYLTAKTSTAVNSFKATQSLDGKVVEDFGGTAAGDNKFTYSYRPNETVEKKPKIDNDSPHEKEMFVGAKVQFYIKSAVNDSSNQEFKEVNYDTFKNFVTIDWNYELNGSTPKALPSAEEDTGKWYEVASSKANDKARYFIYSKHLDADDGDSGAGKEKAGVDTTSQIFNSATVTKDLKLDSTNGIKMLDSHVSAGTLTNTYNGFNYQIVITGYGVDNENSKTLATAANEIKGTDLMNIA